MLGFALKSVAYWESKSCRYHTLAGAFAAERVTKSLANQPLQSSVIVGIVSAFRGRAICRSMWFHVTVFQ